VIPKTDDAVARLPKTGRPHLVAPLRKGVLAAVDLDHQLARKAREIGDIVSDRMLTSKLATGQPTAAQRAPKYMLGAGRVAPERARRVAGYGTMVKQPSPLT